jgi:hypothetical protein
MNIKHYHTQKMIIQTFYEHFKYLQFFFFFFFFYLELSVYNYYSSTVITIYNKFGD